MFTGVVPGEPTGAPSSKSMFAGRKQHTKSKSHGTISIQSSSGGNNAGNNGGISNNASVTSKSADVGNNNGNNARGNKPSGKKKQTSLEELDRMLENDAFALMGMQKELQLSQMNEVDKSNATLKTIKKEYDSLKIENDLKEKNLQGHHDNYKTLVALISSGKSSSVEADGKIQELSLQLEDVNENLAAEQRTQRILSLVSKRLDSEIDNTQVEIHSTSFALDHAKHDLRAKEVTHRISKNEYSEQERQLEALTKSLKSRRLERKAKLQKLHSIVNNGEASVAKIQNSILEISQMSTTSKRPKTNASNRSKSAVGGTREKKRDMIGSRAKNSGGYDSSIQEILERYRSRDSRRERLEALSHEQRENLKELHDAKEQLEEELMKARERLRQLISNRQIYQEVEMKDAALSTAQKEYAEWQERAHRLRVNMESLRRAFPRFLTKITKISHPAPSLEQLPDAVHKLDDEICKLIKQIGAALLKEATAEDVAAAASQQSSNVTGSGNESSEISRLQKLPGFSRLQKQVFYNLMTVKQDRHDRNVRVKPGKDNSDPLKRIQNSANNGNNSTGSNNGIGSNASGENGGNSSNVNNGQDGADSIFDLTLDRKTVKKISKLIMERDGGFSKFKAGNNSSQQQQLHMKMTGVSKR